MKSKKIKNDQLQHVVHHSSTIQIQMSVFLQPDSHRLLVNRIFLKEKVRFTVSQ